MATQLRQRIEPIPDMHGDDRGEAGQHAVLEQRPVGPLHIVDVGVGARGRIFSRHEAGGADRHNQEAGLD